MSAAPREFDPLPSYCFRVTFESNGPASSGQLYFRSVSGIKFEMDVSDFQEGGQNGFVHKLVGGTKWSNIVLKRGFLRGAHLIKWIQDEWMLKLAAGGKPKRANGKIEQLDSSLKKVCEWKFKDAWPCKLDLSEFDAGKSDLAIETLELAHHGLTFVPAAG